MTKWSLLEFLIGDIMVGYLSPPLNKYVFYLVKSLHFETKLRKTQDEIMYF